MKSRNSEIHTLGESQVGSGIKSQSCVKFPDLIGKNVHCWETLGALSSNLFDSEILQAQIEAISTRNQSIHCNPVDLQSLNIF